MIPNFIQQPYNQYHTLFLRYWNQMSPIQYLGLLIGISLIGWVMMKSGTKRC